MEKEACQDTRQALQLTEGRETSGQEATELERAQDKNKVAALQADLQDTREELAILQSKFELEAKYAQHLKKKHETACAEISKLMLTLANVQKQAKVK